jgi:methionyl-tRNA synthetase
MSSKFYVTTPIYYVNDRPHLGHAYTTIIADVVARFQRLDGRDVFFLTGTDEHAAKVVDSAAEHGMSAQQWADRNAEAFEQTFRRLGIGCSDFIRTTQPRHKERVLRYVEQLLASGDVYSGVYEGWYDAGQEEYVTETKAAECDYKSPINGKPLVRKSETNYFFALSRYAEPLLAVIEGDPRFLAPEARRNEIISRIKSGLNDVPISRTGSVDWGIRMPNDPEQTIYVWIDALFNYMTTVDTDERRRYWPPDLQLLAKDIVWFHAVIWPALILALRKVPGNEWMALPRRVYVHSFWISEGVKMSKTLGNFVDLEKIDAYIERFGLDAFRWYLASRGPIEAMDSDFAETRFIEVYNSELANGIGNCTSRVVNMLHRYFGGVLPTPEGEPELRVAAGQAVEAYRADLDAIDLTDGFAAAIGLVRAVDGFIERTAPFKLARDPAMKGRVGTILYECAEALRIAALLMWPAMPDRMAEVCRRLGFSEIEAVTAGGAGNLSAWAEWGGLKPGATVAQGEGLFARYVPAATS